MVSLVNKFAAKVEEKKGTLSEDEVSTLFLLSLPPSSIPFSCTLLGSSLVEIVLHSRPIIDGGKSARHCIYVYMQCILHSSRNYCQQFLLRIQLHLHVHVHVYAYHVLEFFGMQALYAEGRATVRDIAF